MRNKSIWLVIVFIGSFIISGSIILQCCSPQNGKTDSIVIANNQYTGDQSCKSCHRNEYHEWTLSHHYMAMQPANDSTVVGDFNNTSYSADGITSRFFKNEGKYFINTQGQDGRYHDFEIKYIFGFTPLQQYLIAFPEGRMQVTRQSWDVNKKKWFHQNPNQKIAANDWLHWTGNAQNWNTMCASCHSTNLQKKYDIDSDTYHTTYSVINVSCESCHGAGSAHIDYINSGNYQKGKKIEGSFLQMNKKTNQLAQINNCAPCHSRRGEISPSKITSNELLDNYIPQIPDTEFFHADGQVKDEDYVYTSFLQSKMFQRGITCSNCHNVHTGKPVLTGNNTCLQCHQKKYSEPEHTFHTAAIAASECKNCHMPGRYFMGNDYRYEHSFRAPRPDLSVKYGTPNACNNCHTNKGASWAKAAIEKWYGPDRAYHFSEDLIPGSLLNKESEGHLIKLIGDTSIPTIIQATAVFYLGSIPTQKSLTTLINCLNFTDAQTRYRAIRSLSNFEYQTWINAIGPLMADKVRAVRIAAADLYTTIPRQQIPAQFQSTFNSAFRELQSYLAYQADFAVGNLMLADHYLKLQDYYNAEKFYLRGLKKDSLLNYARLNLSTVYNAEGKNDKALEILLAAEKIEPANDRIYFNLALLYNELNDQSTAEKYFAKAIALKTQNPKVYYNYGLLLNQWKNYKEAERILEAGLIIDPASAELFYALTFVYLQSDNRAKARQTAIKLKRLDPSNPNYLPLYQQLGI